jgi:hypothetical protein
MISAQIFSSQDPQAACCRMVCRMVCRVAGHPGPAFADGARGTGRLPGYLRPPQLPAEPCHPALEQHWRGAEMLCRSGLTIFNSGVAPGLVIRWLMRYA